MDAGKTLYRPWVGSQFSYDNPPRLAAHISQGVCTGIEHDGKTVLREGSGLTVDDGGWFESETEARRHLIEKLCDRWEALRLQIDLMTAELKRDEVAA